MVNCCLRLVNRNKAEHIYKCLKKHIWGIYSLDPDFVIGLIEQELNVKDSEWQNRKAEIQEGSL